jgi:hypothetical protein
LRLPGWKPGNAVSRSDAPGPAAFQAYRRTRELACDFFKPTPSAISDTALVRDSVYVKTYREEAWKRTRRRRTFGHYALVGGAVITGAAVIAMWVLLLDRLAEKR